MKHPNTLRLIIVSALVAAIAVAPGPVFSQDYVIGVADVLDVTVLGEPELSRAYAVRVDGKIVLPLLGEFQAAGLTSKELTEKLTAALRRFIKEPQVTVAIRQAARRQFVYLLGQVVRPGAYEYLSGWTLAELLATAGGPTAKASLRRVTILRGKTAIPVDLEQLLIKGNAGANIPLEPGDVVIVSEIDERIHVLGEVGRPGYYELRDGDRVLDIITKAGGLSLKAAPERISVLRDGETLTVDLAAFLNRGRWEQNVSLQSGDIVFVPETENRVVILGQVLKPGPYIFRPGDRVVDLLSMAGGPTPRASMHEVGVIRQNGEKPNLRTVDLDKFFKEGDASQNVLLKPGDVVFVPDRSTINWGAVLESIRQLSFFYLLFR